MVLVVKEVVGVTDKEGVFSLERIRVALNLFIFLSSFCMVQVSLIRCAIEK